jgi:hypothetical protein
VLLALYLSMLAAVVLAVVIAVARAPALGGCRSWQNIFFAAAPCLGIGILSGLVLSANGQPKVEWFVPLAGMVLIGRYCRSERVFGIARWALPVAALVMCGLFLQLVQFTGRYTAEPENLQTITRIRQLPALRSAEESLRERPAGTVLPQERVAVILKNDFYDRVPGVEVTRMWHTPITRIHAWNHVKLSMWYPGGPVETAAKQLVLR